MHEIESNLDKLVHDIDKSFFKLNIAKLQTDADSLELKTHEKDFWQDNLTAQQLMKTIASIHSKIDPWLQLKATTLEIKELLALNDSALKAEIEASLKSAQNDYNQLQKQLAFTGEYDGHDVILSIYAGAGGTDAQDWAAMLQRMYTRWAESEGGKIEIIDQSNGDEAGIKSLTMSISNVAYLYGKLKGEHGVHRLVRLSPFNSDNLRQTSFAKVDVVPKIDNPNEIEIDDKDLNVDVYRAGGHGGQSVNTTDSAVRITHLPTGLTVSIQNERSQLQNKQTALTILRSRLAQLQSVQHKAKISELKGPKQAVEWGSQIRNYVLHPYKQVKDLRSLYETSDPEKVLNGDLDSLIQAFLEYNMGSNT